MAKHIKSDKLVGCNRLGSLQLWSHRGHWRFEPYIAVRPTIDCESVERLAQGILRRSPQGILASTVQHTPAEYCRHRMLLAPKTTIFRYEYILKSLILYLCGPFKRVYSYSKSTIENNEVARWSSFGLQVLRSFAWTDGNCYSSEIHSRILK